MLATYNLVSDASLGVALVLVFLLGCFFSFLAGAGLVVFSLGAAAGCDSPDSDFV